MLFISIISLIIASVSTVGSISSTRLSLDTTYEGWTANSDLNSMNFYDSANNNLLNKNEGIYNNPYSSKLLSRLTCIFLLYSAFISYNTLYYSSLISGIGIYSGLFQITNISQSIEIFIYLIGSIILLPWALNNKNFSLMVSPIVSEYSLIILFTTLGASLLISSSDLISMYLSIELQSFAVYILASIYRDSEASTSAGLKYFLLGALSSCFILLGSGLIYAYTGVTQFESIYAIISVLSNYENINSLILSSGNENIIEFINSSLLSNNEGLNIYLGYTLGIFFILVGFLFKVSAAPFHNWSPDVYDGVPTIITTWLAIMPKISIFIFLLELVVGLNIFPYSISSFLYDNTTNLYTINSDYNFSVLNNLILISSLISLILGTIVGLAQSKIKRLLAYSTISHVGFLLLALGINSEESIESFLFYLIQYSLTNLDTFLILLAFGYTIKSMSKYNINSYISSLNQKEEIAKINDINYINELKGQFLNNPLLSISLSICLFSMAGIPPLIGFFSKQMVLLAAIQNGYYFLSFVAIIVSVISASYYLKIIKVIHFESLETNELISNNGVSNIHSLFISILTLIILFFILSPNLLLNSTHLLALSIFVS